MINESSVAIGENRRRSEGLSLHFGTMTIEIYDGYSQPIMH